MALRKSIWTKLVAGFGEAAGQTAGEGPNSDAAKLYVSLIFEEFAEFAEAVGFNGLSDRAALASHAARDNPLTVRVNECAALDAAVDMVYVIIGLARAAGWDIDGAFAAVHESNMAKFMTRKGTVGARKLDVNGKVIKPRGWTPPNLTPFASKRRAA